jgi:predicted nucleic acid-binding protein
MPSRSRGPDLLVDTSVAVALVVAGHEHHEATAKAVGTRRLGLAGHAAFETFSVLTRLPAPARRPPSTIAELLRSNFPDSRYLSAAAAADLFERLTGLGIAGGSVYDALVGATAVEHSLALATRDRRALDTYRALDVQVEVVGSELSRS